MKALLKNRNRVLAFVMALAMVLTMIPMGIAFADEIVYTVKASKPAIPAKQGNVIDLAKIAVELGGDTYRGDELDWSTEDTTGGIVVDDSAKQIAYFGSDIYVAKATDGIYVQNIYIFETDENGNKVIYDHTFSTDDITYANSSYGEFTAASEWKLYDMGRGAGYTDVAGIKGYSSGIVVTNVGSSGYVDAALYLDPDSASGKRVSAFADMTLLINASSTEGGNVGNWVGPYLHLNLGTNGAVDSTAQYSSPRFIVRSGTGFLRNYLPSGTSDIAGSTGTPLTGGSAFALRYTINGKSVTAESDVGGAGTFDALARTYTDNNLPVSGTIGLYSAFNVRPVFTSVTVTVSFDISRMEEYFSDMDIYIVSAESPIIPMSEGQKLDLSKLFFEFDNGTVAAGSQIAWTTKDATGGIKVNNTDKSIILFNEGFYEVIAAYSKAGEPKTFYVATPDANKQVVIYNKTFSASDFDANGYLTEESEWYSSYNDNQAKFTEKTGAYGLYDYNKSTVIYLRPDSDGGKVVGSFRDITYEVAMRPIDQMNWWGYAAPIARVNATGSINENLTGMTYVATYYSTLHPGSSHTAQNHAASGNCNGVLETMYEYASVSGKENSKINSGVSIPLNATSKYKMVLKGDTYSSYVNAGSGYVETTMELTDDQVTAMASTKAGTIGIYSSAGYRAGIASAKVYVDVAQEIIDAMAARSTYIDIIPADKPAIPISVGKKVDVSKIYFEFDNGTIALGKDITWSTTDTKGGVIVADADKTIALLGSGIYTIKATYNGESKEFAVLEPSKNNTRLIYQHTFSAADIADGNFVADSDWQLLSGSSTNPLTVNTKTGGITADNATAYYALKPDSEAAKLISNFRDVVMEAQLGFTTLFGQYGANFIMGVRANWADNQAPSGTPATYVGGGYRTCLDANTANSHKDYAYSYVSGKTSAQVTFNESYTQNNHLRTYKVSAIGDTFEIYRDGVALGAAVTADQATAIKNTKAGSIWFKATGNDRLILRSVEVTAVFSAEVVEMFKNNYVGDAHVVSAAKPAIPMQVDKKASIGNLYFEFDNGIVAKGDSITWSAMAGVDGVVVINAEKAITLRKKGIHPVTATYQGLTQTFYVMDVESNQRSLFEYNFSASDLPAALTAATGETVTFGAGDAWKVYVITGPASISYANNASFSAGGVVNNNQSESVLYLNPDSEAGKLISDFSDYTVDFTSQPHFNFRNNGIGFSMLGRYNMSGSNPDFANDIYSGYYFYWSATKNGAVAYSNNQEETIANSAFTDYNSDNTLLDFRLKFDGADFEAFVKNDAQNTYKKVYSSENDSYLSVAKTAVNQGGTFAIYSLRGTRPTANYFNVTINFTNAEIEAIKNCYVPDNAYFVMQSKPAIPVKSDAIVDLNNIMVEMSDGTIKHSSDIVWEWGSDDLLYNEEDNTLGIYARGSYPVKAKLNDADEGVTIYFVTPNNLGDYEVYDKTFSADDIANGNFVADSDWQLLPGSSENPLTVNSATGGITAGSGTAYYALKPTSDIAKLISGYRDIVMESQIGFTTLFGQFGYDFTMGVRANWADNQAPSGVPATYVGGGYRTCLDVVTAQSHKDYAYTYVSGKASAQVTFNESYTQNNHLRTYKVSAIGDTFEVYRDGVALGAAMTDAQSAAIKETKAGTVWIESTANERIILRSVKLYIVFSEEEIESIQATDIDFEYVVDAQGSGDKYSEKIFTTVSDAIAYIGENGGEIKIRGNVTTESLSSSAKAAHKDIVITSYDGVAANNTLTISNATIALYGNITFENITVVPKTEILTGKDYTLTFGEGSVAKEISTYRYNRYSNGNNIVINSPTVSLNSTDDKVFYGYDANIDYHYNLTINDGTHGKFLLGAYANNGMTLNGDISLTLNGGSLKSLYTGHGGDGTGHDTILRGNTTFIMNDGIVSGGVYIDSMGVSRAGRDAYVHNLTYIFNEKTMNNTVVLASGNVIKHLRDESKWVVILNNAENSKVSVRDGATDDVDYFISVNGGTAEPVYTGRTSEDAASNELLGFKFKSDNSDKTKVFVNNKTIVDADENGVYDLSIFQGDAIHVEFVSEDDVVISYDEIEDISSYRADGYKAPEKDGYVFGGWFGIDEETGKFVALTEEEANAATSAHAKFVPQGVLGIAWQLKLGTTTESATTDIRFITTVDSLDYRRVEFVMNLGGRDSKPIVSSVAYTTLYGFSKGITRYTPEETFSPESSRFIPALITNIPNSVFANEAESPLYVTASWVTMDGTKVSGEKKQIKFSRALEDSPKYDQAIVCWGDSITMGLGMGANQNYPDVLNGLIQDDIKVLNAGVGGENSASILSRANLLPTTVYSTINFAAGQREVALTESTIFKGLNGESLRYVHYVMGNRLSIRKVFIGGEEFELSALPEKTGGYNTFMLRRKGDISEPLTLEPGVEVRFDYSGIYTSTYCNIALIGCNDGSGFSLDTLIARYRAIEQSADNFIAIVPFYYADYSDRFEAEFPGQCVDYRNYIRSEDCFNKYGADLGYSSLDDWNAAWAEVDAQGVGYILPGLSQDGSVTNVHLSALGYKIMADLVYAKGVELRYWK